MLLKLIHKEAMMKKETITQALELAQKLQEQITLHISATEKAFHKKMQKLLNNPKSKVMLIELLDRSFRCQNKRASFDFIEQTLKKYGIADFFTPIEKTLLFVFLTFGKLAPRLSVPFFVKHVRDDTRGMVLDSSSDFLQSHIKKRQAQNITLNVNLIGEEVLGEAESKYRIQKYQEALKSSYITYISIKITTIFSQINILDFEYSKAEIVKRLDYLYGIALSEEKTQNIPKFINLDMEEFKDLELTVSAFMESIAKFPNLNAGIVLQAYIPDSFRYLKILHTFSKQRVQNGAKPIKIRFVKGANMESEETIASQKGWACPTFDKKIDTDSNYNKMLEFILEDENYKYINIGIASHNIFEIAYAYTRISQENALEFFTFEMLEGMSMQASFELAKIHKLILYAPVCDESHFNNAIAYLVRRLDENTSEDNFMRYFFNLHVGDVNWELQKKIFLEAINGIAVLDNSTRRIQNRNLKSQTKSSFETHSFVNEPDMDFVLPQNRAWAQQIKAKYQNPICMEVYPVLAQIAQKDTQKTTNTQKIYDKIHNKHIANLTLADKQTIQNAIEVASKSDFSNLSHKDIYATLAKVAQLIRERRGDLLGIAALEVGKTFAEVDSEVSEAIDFLEFYPYSLQVLKEQNPKTSFTAKGIGVVIAPWNFPIGISVGTIAAPLAAGNKVIYKPSTLSALCGLMVCECFWDAGIPKDALIYLPSKGSDISQHLLSNPLIQFAVLTGGEETAYKILESNPTLQLSAETGGKNATIVTKMADRDQAIKNIIHSAFSNSGQKCSATSLLILEEEVYNDETFKQTLVDAAKSMSVGDPFEFKNKIGTLANEPDTKLKKAIDELRDYEYWALKPKFLHNNKKLMTPGIKYGTKVGDFTHQTELFAPLLTVMCAKNLDDALYIANSTGYGLTSALESLDEREWEYYINRIEAGNIYINKPSTGAIVLRQPFGGVKKSAIGFGRKVGIFNYITQFLHITQDEPDGHLTDTIIEPKIKRLLESSEIDTAQKEALKIALMMTKSYVYHRNNEFNTQKDYVKIRGEDNLFSYTHIANMAYRYSKNDSLQDILGVIIGAQVSKTPLTISFKEHDKNLDFAYQNLEKMGLHGDFVKESDESFASKISEFERIRYMDIADSRHIIYQKAAQYAKVIIKDKPILNGRFELLYYYNEKSVSISYHRYGNLGARALQSLKD